VVARFQAYGPIKSCVLLTHKDSGKSKGCAMVLFHKWAHAGASETGRARTRVWALQSQQGSRKGI
jgi:hypothetical protein